MPAARTADWTAAARPSSPARDGAIRHFWSQEMIASDPGQDPRGAPDPAPLWTVLDMTPEGRGADWYPSLEYPA